MELTLTVNGKEQTINFNPNAPLSALLRDKLELKGTKRGCETGKCGACTVIVDGKATKSCQRLAGQTCGCDVLTIEGLADRATNDEELHPVQKSFVEKFGLQCGYCTPGMVMMSAAYLTDNPDPTRKELQNALKGNFCRCTGYTKIYDSVLDAAVEIEDSPIKRPNISDD